MALDLETTYDQIHIELEMAEEEVLKVVRTCIRPEGYSVHVDLMKSRGKNYLMNCLEFQRANKNIQPLHVPLLHFITC